jgi:myo-inositol-1(or 4)-monophosphatase
MTTKSGADSRAHLLPRIAAAKRAVLAQTELLHREFGRAESHWKSDGTRVTPVDVAISENIFRDLRAEFPDDHYFSEESSELSAPVPLTRPFSWVLDPIDGTNNFALGIPHCAIALALVEGGMPVYGVVYDLSRRTLMHGGPGFGLQDGERSAQVAPGPPGRDSLIGLHSPSDKSLVPLAEAVLARFKVRALGSATLHLAYVAAGLLDGAADYNVKIWDLAAAIPLLRAAGGEICFINGEQLPMRQFDLHMPRIIYVSGGPAMLAELKNLTRRQGT